MHANRQTDRNSVPYNPALVLQVLETVPSKLEKASDADVVQTVAVLLNDDPLQEEDQKMRNILMR